MFLIEKNTSDFSSVIFLRNETEELNGNISKWNDHYAYKDETRNIYMKCQHQHHR